MHSSATIVILCSLLAAGTPESDLAPREGVLILKNGGVLSGRVTRAGDYYLVTVGSRSEVRVAVREVDLHCVSLDEAYRRKRARVPSEDLSGRLDLADWCLRHGLTAAAADELLAVMARQPGHLRLPGLVRRLNTAVEPPRERAATKPRPDQPVSREQLERFSRELPVASVEQFTTQIQPLLFNRCGGSGCHGGHTGTDFRLIRPSGAATLTRRFTQRNLYSVLQQVDRQAPDSSPLLQKASTPHGGRDTPMFGPREREQFELLAAWVHRAVGSAEDQPTEPDAYAAKRGAISDVQPAHATLPAEDAAGYVQPAQYLEPDDARRLPTPSGEPKFVPRDPFDPEIFNRRYRTTQSAGEPPGEFPSQATEETELPGESAEPRQVPSEPPIEPSTFPPPFAP